MLTSGSHCLRHLREMGARSAGTGGTERRNTWGRVEVRAGGAGRVIGGQAVVFHRESRNLGSFVEVVLPQFFDQTRADGWPGTGDGVVCRYQHKDEYLLGTTRAGTLRLEVNPQGLSYDVDTPLSRQDVLELVERGDISQSSFAFRVSEEEWSRNAAGYTQRSLVSGVLIDVAPVLTPAYEDTSVGLRHLADLRGIPFEDVAALAGQHRLDRLFVRTDRRTMSGAQARAHVMGRRWGHLPPRGMSAAQAKMYLAGKRIGAGW